MIEHIDELIDVLKESYDCLSDASDLADAIYSTWWAGGTILICGNGGSAADASHFSGELVGRFEAERDGIPAIALVDPAVLTALGNDYGYEHTFSRQVQALGREGDLLICISTSGNSENVIRAAIAAGAKGMTVASMTGSSGGKLANLADIIITVPSKRTCRIQEVQQVLIHAICRKVEDLLL